MTTQARFQCYDQLHQRRARVESQSETRFGGQYWNRWGERIRLAHGRTPLSLACSWGSRISLEDIERRATSPWAPISRLGQGYEPHVSCVSGFKDGRFGTVAVLVCSKSGGAPSVVVSTKIYLMLSDVAIAITILAWYVCNAVDQINLAHVDG